jgi:hypothetical protein
MKKAGPALRKELDGTQYLEAHPEIWVFFKEARCFTHCEEPTFLKIFIYHIQYVRQTFKHLHMRSTRVSTTYNAPAPHNLSHNNATHVRG